MTLQCTAAGLTNTGQVRPKNEDRCYVDSQHGVFIVADGIGGKAAGDVAAQIVVKALPNLLRKRLHSYKDITTAAAKRAMVKAVQEFSNRLREKSAQRRSLAGMGSTVVAMMARDNAQALLVYMGDSRVYLLRDGELKRLTHDHSLIQLLLDEQEISPEEADSHFARGQITRYVGMDGYPLPDAIAFNLQAHDRILLCSDGLTDMLKDDQIKTILATPSSPPKQTCQHLIDQANIAGGHDNITAVIVDCKL